MSGTVSELKNYLSTTIFISSSPSVGSIRAMFHCFYCGILSIVPPDLKKQIHCIKHCCLPSIVDTLAASGSSGTCRLCILITIRLVKNVKSVPRPPQCYNVSVPLLLQWKWERELRVPTSVTPISLRRGVTLGENVLYWHLTDSIVPFNNSNISTVILVKPLRYF